MKQINIKPDDTIIFEKYFSQCDIDKSGKVSPTEANKFFLRSGLPIEDLYKINEYCGANRLGYFGRSQFYIALKAIASAQAGQCVDEQIIHHNIGHIPPRFDHHVSAEAVNSVLQKSFETCSSIPPPPNKYHMRTLSGNNILQNLHQRAMMSRYPYNSPTAKLQGQNSLKGSLDKVSVKFNSFDQTEMTHVPFFESDDDENNGESYEEEENKGLLNPSIKTDFNHLYSLNGDDVELSSSTDHESSSFSGESEENDDDVDNDADNHDATGYTLMEPVEGLAVVPTDIDKSEAIPMATGEQLDYYTKCFQTIQSSDTRKVLGSDAIGFFQLYHLDDEHIKKILSITNIEKESDINLVQFSRALHLINHQKTGFSIPDTEPDNLLPVDFEQPDEPFSFDLSTGEQADLQTINQLSSIDSSYSADGDSSNFDTTDVAAARRWSKQKVRAQSANKHRNFLCKSYNSPGMIDLREDASVVSRPRPYARKSLSLPQAIPNPVAPPPPPRSSVPSEPLVKIFTFERHADPSGDASSSSNSEKSAAQDDSPLRKRSESSRSDGTANKRPSTNVDTRKQLLNSIKESKSKNHVLLRLNNEMTSELEELREQRVNLHLQLEYIKQSQQENS